MWYLILPPLIVIASLAFLLWYLSRQGADPRFIREVSRLDAETKQESFSFVKVFVLRVLDRLTQRSKVATLRLHNTFNEWSRSIRERRRAVQENVEAQTAVRADKTPVWQRLQFWKNADQDAGEEPRVSAGEYVSDGSDDGSREPVVRFATTDNVASDGLAARPRPADGMTDDQTNLTAPILRRRRPLRAEVSDAGVSVGSETEEPRPMVSESVTRPEVVRRISRDALREERLIGRIAANPKDFTAYEDLGDYYLEVGNITDAKECYRQVLKLSPVHRMVKIKIRRLEKLLAAQSHEPE